MEENRPPLLPSYRVDSSLTQDETSPPGPTPSVTLNDHPQYMFVGGMDGWMDEVKGLSPVGLPIP